MIRFVGLVLLLMLPRVAWAQEDPRETASRHFEEGTTALESGEDERALESFRAAQALVPNGTTLWNIVVLELRLGRTLEAHRDLGIYIELAGSEPQERIDMAKEKRARLEAELARLRVRASPPHAEVSVDGEKIDGWVWRTAGAHVVEVRAPRHRASKREVRLEPGSALDVDVTLSIEREAPPPARPVRMRKTEREELRARPMSARRIAGWTVGAVGVASLAVGTGFGVQAILKGRESDDHCPTPDSCDAVGVELDRQGVVAANVANVTIAVGLAAFGVGLTLVLWPEPDALQLRMLPGSAQLVW